MSELIIKKCMKCGATVKVLEDCDCMECGIKCCNEQMKNRIFMPLLRIYAVFLEFNGGDRGIRTPARSHVCWFSKPVPSTTWVYLQRKQDYNITRLNIPCFRNSGYNHQAERNLI